MASARTLMKTLHQKICNVSQSTMFRSRICYQEINKKQIVPFIKQNNGFRFQSNRKQKASGQEGLPVTWKRTGIAVIVGSGILWLIKYMEKKKNSGEPKIVSVGKPNIGGDWELIDHNGKLRNNKEFYSKWLLIYFGFTHCPDVCPDEMEKIVKVVDTLNNTKSAADIIPMFITLDPDRDNVKVVGEYVKEFSSKFIGLTGSDEQIKNVTKAYKVYYSSGPKDEDNDYIVDHSIIMYLVNPDGEFTGYYGQKKTKEEITESIQEFMKKFELTKKNI